MAEAMFIINAKDGACSSEFTGSLRPVYVSDKLPFRLPVRILDALAYIGLYKLALHMGADPVWMVMAVKCCLDIHLDKTASKNGFVGYYFTGIKVLGFEEESVQVGQRACSSSGGSTNATLATVPVFFTPIESRRTTMPLVAIMISFAADCKFEDYRRCRFGSFI